MTELNLVSRVVQTPTPVEILDLKMALEKGLRYGGDSQKTFVSDWAYGSLPKKSQSTSVRADTKGGCTVDFDDGQKGRLAGYGRVLPQPLKELADALANLPHVGTLDLQSRLWAQGAGRVTATVTLTPAMPMTKTVPSCTPIAASPIVELLWLAGSMPTKICENLGVLTRGASKMGSSTLSGKYDDRSVAIVPKTCTIANQYGPHRTNALNAPPS